MRTDILIAVVVGLLFFAGSLVMTALAIKYATSNFLWDVLLWVGIAGMICSAMTLGLFMFLKTVENHSGGLPY
jgi:ABC-type cobalamin transport system permease subunit